MAVVIDWGGTLSAIDGSALRDTCRSLDPSICRLWNQGQSMAPAVQIEQSVMLARASTPGVGAAVRATRSDLEPPACSRIEPREEHTAMRTRSD
jgi:hypothetical protein